MSDSIKYENIGIWQHIYRIAIICLILQSALYKLYMCKWKYTTIKKVPNRNSIFKLFIWLEGVLNL